MQVEIKGREYKVTEVDFIEDNVIGRTDRRAKTIKIIRDEEKTEETIHTIIHELLHAYLDECGLLKESCNESFNYWLETNFLQMLDSLLKIIPLIYPGYTKNCKTIEININKMIKEK